MILDYAYGPNIIINALKSEGGGQKSELEGDVILKKETERLQHCCL